MKITSGEINKALTALAAFAGEVVNAGLVHGTAARWVAVIIPALAALGVYFFKNTPPAAPPAK